MDKVIFDKGLEDFLIAFPNVKMTKNRAEVWYKYCKFLTDEEWLDKISNCIKYCCKSEPVLGDIMFNYKRREDEKIKYKTV